MKLKLIIINIIITFLYWILESLIHIFIFNSNNDYSQYIFIISPYELWMRICVISFLTFFTLYFYSIHSKTKKKRSIIK